MARSLEGAEEHTEMGGRDHKLRCVHLQSFEEQDNRIQIVSISWSRVSLFERSRWGWVKWHPTRRRVNDVGERFNSESSCRGLPSCGVAGPLGQANNRIAFD